ncbi:MAG TPA: hypothetical protein VKT30_13200 [Caulobacteraceae bacterium]|nr:hypothetical protein [Caulobacteraceae bacterium]
MKKAKRHALEGMPFDEALERLIQTKPEEVKPPPGQKRKVSKAAKRLAKAKPATSSNEQPSQKS